MKYIIKNIITEDYAVSTGWMNMDYSWHLQYLIVFDSQKEANELIGSDRFDIIICSLDEMIANNV